MLFRSHPTVLPFSGLLPLGRNITFGGSSYAFLGGVVWCSFAALGIVGLLLALVLCGVVAVGVSFSWSFGFGFFCLVWPRPCVPFWWGPVWCVLLCFGCFFVVVKMEFDLEKFVLSPSVEALMRCRKADLLLVAEFYNIPVTCTARKADIRERVLVKLREEIGRAHV